MKVIGFENDLDVTESDATNNTYSNLFRYVFGEYSKAQTVAKDGLQSIAVLLGLRSRP